MSEIENHRKIFRPKKMRILFIGESVPNGGTFFYYANSILFKAFMESFEKVYGEFEDNVEFLKFFVANEFYLDDLCLKPINQLDKSRRKIERQNSINSLSERIKFYNPQKIVIVMKAIEYEVKEAIKRTNKDLLKYTHVITFPAGSEKNRKACIKELISIIGKDLDEIANGNGS